MVDIVHILGSDNRRYQKIADDETYPEKARVEAKAIAAYTVLLLIGIANGSITNVQEASE